MISEYSCIFGISADMKELEPGHIHRTHGKGFTTVIMVGKNHRTFWFLFAKMDRKYTMRDLPRFTVEDRERHVAQYFDVRISSEVTFEDLYKRGVYKTYVPLEEAFFEYWVVDRLVCIGDSVHKVRNGPNYDDRCLLTSEDDSKHGPGRELRNRERSEPSKLPEAIHRYARSVLPYGGSARSFICVVEGTTAPSTEALP